MEQELIFFIGCWLSYKSVPSNRNEKFGLKRRTLRIQNKTGLQPGQRPVDQVHYFGGWVAGGESLCWPDFADRQLFPK